jgi:crotonobetainyl-CoA:carnitine CoA-transferase CaiB-like acyl-CoA transferase
VEVDHPVAGKLEYPGLAYQFSGVTKRPRAGAPLLGQHNEEVFGKRLHYAAQDLLKLRQAGVI